MVVQRNGNSVRCTENKWAGIWLEPNSALLPYGTKPFEDVLAKGCVALRAGLLVRSLCGVDEPHDSQSEDSRVA